MDGFNRSLAILIGINDYRNGITPLKTAVNDASQLAQVLMEEHGYETQLLIEHVTLEKLNKLLREILPKEAGPDDRVLFYFAGHGVALESDEGPAGYLIPQDARSDDRHTFLSMQEVHDALTSLSCRHLLTILDCCFAGAFRWYSTRHFLPLPEIIHRERYERFIRDPAWQVITSAAYNQRSLDVLAGNVLGVRGEEQEHSPFAWALFEALRGAGDIVPPGKGDGVITATELYLYLDQETGQFQTPSIWPLKKHDKGQYIFLVPGHSPDLPPAPQLTAHNNPWRGLESYDEEHSDLFFGREALIQQLAEKIDRQPLSVVLGSSGIGKSSLVKAGVLPYLSRSNHVNKLLSDQLEKTFFILPTFRPGVAPLQTLRMTLAAHLGEVPNLSEFHSDPNCLSRIVSTWRRSNSHLRLMLVIDQLEELITLCRESKEREQFLQLLTKSIQAESEHVRVVLVVRSDFEPHFTNLSTGLADLWSDARFVVPPMNQDELRKVIERPASLRVLYFEPDELIDKLINEVVQTPRALPLLSFTLSELYLKYLKSERDNRALTLEDYNILGGVVGSLQNRANEEYANLDTLAQGTMRNVMLRMVAVGGGEVARRRVLLSELEYLDEAENKRKDKVLDQLVDARLVVKDSEASGEVFVEPAHDALVRGWGKLRDWQQEAREYLPLQRLVSQAAGEWERAEDGRSKRGLLWDDNPRLPQLENVLKQKRGHNSNDMWLNRIEAQFVEASSQRKRLNTQRLIGITSVAFLVLVSLLIFAFNQRNLFQNEAIQRTTAQAGAQFAEATAIAERDAAQRQSQISLARSLAALAPRIMERTNDTELATLLALESMRLDQEVRGNTRVLIDSSLREILNHPYFNVTLHRVTDTNYFTDDYVDIVAFSPDGKILAAADGNTVLIWELSHPGNNPLVLPIRGVKRALAFSPDGKILAVSDSRGFRLLDMGNLDRSLTASPFGNSWINTLAFGPDGQTIASGSDDGTVAIWKLSKTGTEATLDKSILLSETGSSVDVESVAFSKDGQRLATSDFGGTVRLLNVGDLSLNSILLENNKVGVYSADFNPDGHLLAACDGEGNIYLWDLRNPGAEPTILKDHKNWVTDVSFSPDGKMLASASADHTIRLWDLNRLDRNPIIISGHEDIVKAITFSPDGSQLASAGYDRTVRLWDLTTPAAAPVTFSTNDQATGNNWVSSVAFSKDGQTLASTGLDGYIHLWNLSSLNGNSTILPGHFEQNYPGFVAFSPDGRLLAAAGGGGNITDSNKAAVRLWDLTRPDVNVTLPVSGTNFLTFIAFAPDGKTLSTEAGTVLFWDIRNFGKGSIPVTRFRSKYGSRLPIAFSPDGKLLAVPSPGETQTINLWKLANLDAEPIRLVQKDGVINSMTFSPDGRFLAAAGNSRLVSLFNLGEANPKPITLPEQEFEVQSIAFSPDGHTLASVAGRFIRLWDIENLQADPVPFLEHQDDVLSLAFSPDGKVLASAGRDGTIRLRPTLDGLISIACSMIYRNLSFDEWTRYLPGETYRQTCPNLPPDSVSFIEGGEQLAEAGQIEKAIATFDEAQRLDPSLDVSAKSWNKLCWFGSLWGHAKEVFTSCEKAVKLDPSDGNFRDSRGVARTLTQDYAGAIQDFEFFIKWVRDNERYPLNQREEWVKQRQDWIDKLKSGLNPFDETTLEVLRNQ